MNFIYKKVKLTLTVNGSFRQTGLLIGSTRTGDVWYATNDDNIAFPADTAGTPAFPLRVRDGRVVGALHGPYLGVSFATIARMVSVSPENNPFPFLTGIMMDPDGEVGTIADDTTEVSISALMGSSTSNADPDMEGVAIKSGYTTTEVYQGLSGYHSNQRNHRFNTPIVADKPWRIGVELEVYARSSEAYSTITRARSNWFQCESDSSLNQTSYPIEIKTIPLRACDAKSVDFWNAPMAKLRTLARSKGYTSTGLHVHIGREILGNTEMERQKTLAKLNLFYVYMVEDIPANHDKNVTICGRERGYSGTLDFAKTELGDFVKSIGVKALEGINEEGNRTLQRSLNEKCRGQRWDINIQHLNDYGTIEFRKGDGRISKTRMVALITWWEQMVLYCKETELHELNFDDFFRKVVNENPCVAYFFNQDEEA